MTTLALAIILAIGIAALFLLKPEQPIKNIIYFVLGVCAFIWLLAALGVLPHQVHLP